MKKIDYSYINDINKLEVVYNSIRCHTKHRQKILKFEIFYTSNMINIQDILKSKNYKHGKYNIFLITRPKARIIMSDSMTDKIINHLVSYYVLFPLLTPKLIETNVATRVDKGTKAGLFYIKKYVNSMKENHDKIYVLKCDISKYFYSIDHEILMNKLSKIIEDKDLLKLIYNIIDSTNASYINEDINNIINERKKQIYNSNISKKEKEIKIKELNKIPLYQFGKGLPIGNMSSQILAIFYMNDLDHFIKEKLRIKYYIRYMDDLVLLHHDKEYLKYCLKEIEKKVKELRLSLNNKTQIVEIHNGLTFLGHRIILKNQRLYLLMDNKNKKNINKAVNNLKDESVKTFLKERYNGYLKIGDKKGYVYNQIKKDKKNKSKDIPNDKLDKYTNIN